MHTTTSASTPEASAPPATTAPRQTYASPVPPPATRRRDERGEGVISTAIAVLIVAFLGIALWTGFDGMMDDATDRTRAQVEQIGG
jgi:uncharacterized protein HemX